MKIRQHLAPSNKTNQPSYSNEISQKSLSFSQANTQQVFIQLKKTEPSHKFTKHNKQNISAETVKKGNDQERNTIKSAIKQLLKGEQALFNYLESQKQFISVLDSHNPNLRNQTGQRGKLTSSLTEKKKSRNDTYYVNKAKMNSNFKKLNECLQNEINSNKIVKNSSVTVEVFNKDQQLVNQVDPQVQSKHYETISFNKIKTQPSEKYQHQNPFLNEKSTQKYCFVMNSPTKKKQQINEKGNNLQKNFYTTKYGLTNFSPWALPKDTHKNDFDLELNSPQKSTQDQIRIQVRSAFKEKRLNQEQIKKQKFPSKSTQVSRKASTALKSQQKKVSYQKEAIQQSGQIYTKLDFVEDLSVIEENKNKEIQTNKRQRIQDLKQRSFTKKQNCYDKQTNQKMSIKKGNYTPLKTIDHTSLMKSSQVVIVQGQPEKFQEIFAPKANKKQYMNQMNQINQMNQMNQIKGIKKQTYNVGSQLKIFQTQVDEIQISYTHERQEESSFIKKNCKTLQSNEDLLQQNELTALKKTEEFLKQIIINKGNVSYSASNSKKQLKGSFHIDETNAKPHHTNGHMKFKTQNNPRNQHEYLQANLNYSNKANEISVLIFQKNRNGKQNHSCGQMFEKKKAKTSLGKPLTKNPLHQLISSSNTKYLTQASLNGFYMSSSSKISSEKNAIVRMKRHSLLLKNRKNSNSIQAKPQTQKKKHSLSMDKQGINKVNLNLLQEATGFGITNPLTKQLYKKYVSIVQQKRS